MRKLLALAEDPAATVHEAETYTAKAAQLIADYGIDQALLAAATPGSDPVGDRVLDLDAPYAADKADLLATIASLTAVPRRHPDPPHAWRARSVRCISSGMRPTSSAPSCSTRACCSRAPPGWLGRRCRGASTPPRSVARGWRASGWRSAAGSPTAESRAETEAATRFAAAGRSSALVLADRRREVESTMHAAYPRLTTARPRSLSGSGVADGWAAGQRADLGGRPVEETTKARHLQR